MRSCAISLCMVFFFIVIFNADGLARRTYFTPEQKAQLTSIQTVWINVLALTERGTGDGQKIQGIVEQRLEGLEYTIVTDRDVPSDVMVRVKCEEKKKWSGTTRAGGDADHVDAPARLWKGPACLFSYRLNGRDLGWYKEVRTEFEDPVSAAKAANAPKSGPYAIEQLAKRLQDFDFPIMIAAEWGHDARLLKLLEDPNTPKRRKLKILGLLPQLQSHAALPYLKDFIKDKELAEEAIGALATTGSDAIPLLTEVFQTESDSSIRAAAAKGLGAIGARTGNPTITPPLLVYLTENLKHMNTSADIDFPVLTEVVWSLGKLRNERSIPPIAELETKIWVIYDTSPEMSNLRDATNWTHKQIDMDGQIQ